MPKPNAERRLAQSGPATSTQLVTHLIESPGLVRALRELPPPVLGKLIDSVGLESAGDLVALATNEQLGAVFDEDLWTRRAGSAEERFDAARFALWLQVLFEAGEEAVVERLTAWSPDFLTLVLARLVLVVDIDQLGVELSEAGEELEWTEKALEGHLCEEWEEFRLIARDPSAWDVVWEAIVALDREDHEFVRSLLERCAALSNEFIEDNGGLYEVLTSDEMLESDARAERDDRRAAKGYVSAPDARAFLELAKRGDTPEDRDPITKAYFRELDRAASNKPAVRARAADGRHRRELVERLEAAQIIESSTSTPLAGLLGAATHRASDARSAGRATLEGALSELGERDPKLYAERLEELGYLANVLIAGLGTRERRLRPVQALDATLELVGLALERGLGIDKPAPALDVLSRVSADRLFRAAYRMLFEQPRDPEVRRIRGILGALATLNRNGARRRDRRQ